jgi:hypothetical protein
MAKPKKIGRPPGSYVPARIRDHRRAITERLDRAMREIHGEKASARAIAEALEVSQTSWRNYLDGALMPGLVMLGAVARHGIESDYLLHGTGPMFRADSQKPARSAG